MTSEANTAWVVPDVWETIARVRPDAECISQGKVRLSWRDFDARGDGFARRLLELGLGRQAKVAFALRNCPEFLIGVFGCLKAGLVPLNTNFRYTAHEAAEIWTCADAECVVFSASIVDTVAQARERCPRVRSWIQVGVADVADPGRAEWAAPFPGPAEQTVRPPWGRTPDDLLLLFTGGTTGPPKGVMWRQDDVFAILNSTAAVRYPAAEGIDGVARMQADEQRYRPRFLPCGPLIHGTASFSAYGVLGAGGSVVLLPGAHFDAGEVLDTIDAEGVTHLSVIGEAHARPLLDRLEAEPRRWSLRSLRLVTSAGTALLPATRDVLLRCCPDALYVDLLGSSEAPRLGRARSTRSTSSTAGTFQPGPDVRVVTEDGRAVRPGSGEVGAIVVRGRGPLGYYNDPDTNASLFRVIDGERWIAPGDLATVEPDGTLRLRGRASAVVNTGGEKVYPREVEDALLTHPSVADAAVIGLPHEVLGQMVVAAVQPLAHRQVYPQELDTHLRTTLAGYKVPKQIHVLDSVGRGENGKIDQVALVRRLSALCTRTQS
jgi:acyl-CoA synthetase (AMP-forming)/AMP-acid ligase II